METLFFIASKLAGALLKVETWLLLLALLAFWAAWRERMGLAKAASGILATAILLVGAFPFGDLLFAPIEATYRPGEAQGDVDGIIVLGGGEDVAASLASGQAQVGEGGDRYLAALALAHRHPEARLLFAGGSGRLRDAAGVALSEADVAERIFLEQGLAPGRLLFERRSRNTAENARLSLETASPASGETWLLVTSAFHMQRALQSFLSAGWEGLVPHPVDYRSRSPGDAMGWNFGRNIGLVNSALRERVGRAVYAATGR